MAHDETVAGGHDEQRYDQDFSRTPSSVEEPKSKVARVEGWEPFDQIERSELDDH